MQSSKNMSGRKNHLLRAAALAAAAMAVPLGLGTSAQAASQTWKTAGFTDGAWATADNWVDGAVPGANSTGATNSDVATFNGGTNLTITVDATRSVGSLYFDTADAGAFTISSGELYLINNGAISISSSVLNAQTIASPIFLSNNTTAKGYTFVNNSEHSGVTLDIQGDVTARSPSGSSATALTISGAGNGVLSGDLLKTGAGTGSFNVVKNGTGAWTLSGNNNQNITSLSGGTLNLNSAGALGSAGTLVIASGTIDNTSGGAITLSSTGAITFSGNFAFGGTNDLTFGPGNIAADTQKTITLGGTDSTLTFGGVLRNTNNAARTLTINGAGNTIVFNGWVMNAGGSGGFTQTVAGSGDVLFTGALVNRDAASPGTQALRYSGTGTLTLAANNTYSGNTTIDADGTLQVGNGGTTGDLGVSTNAVTNNGTLAFDRSDSFTWTRVITGSGNLVHKGAGNLTLSAANTFSGQTSVQGGGNLVLANSSALANSTILVPAVGTRLQFDSSVASNAFSIGGLTGSNGLVLANNAATPINLTVGGVSTSSSYTGIISGNGTLTKTGTGVFAVGNVSTYDGATTVNNGVLRLLNAALPSVNSNVNLTATGKVEITSNTTLSLGAGANQIQLTGTTVGFGAFGGAYSLDLGNIVWGTGVNTGTALQLATPTSTHKLTLVSNIDLNGASRTITTVNSLATGAAAEITGVISGTASVTLNGGGHLQLSGDSTYDGVTAISGGTRVEVANLGDWSATPTAGNLGAPTSAATGRINLGAGPTTSGTLVYVGAGETTNRQINVGSGGTGTVLPTGTIEASGTGALVLTAFGVSPVGTGSTASLNLGGTNTDDNTLSAAINNSNITSRLLTKVTKTGTGTWVLTSDDSTFSFNVLSITGGTLVARGDVEASVFKTGSVTNGSADVTVSDTTGLTVGDLVYGSETNGDSRRVITAINGDVVTLDAAATGATGSATLEFVNAAAQASVFGSSRAKLVLGAASTTSNNWSPSVLIDGAYTIARPILIDDFATTGAYSLGGRSNSATAAFSGLVSTSQNLSFTQTAGGTLNVTGGVTGATAGEKTVTFAGPGAINVATTGLSDGAGTLNVAVSGGTTRLNVASTYSGTTTVAGGTLLVNNTTGSGTGTGPVGVASAGTIGGTGTLRGALTLNGTVAPGNAGVGRLTVDNDITASATAAFTFQVNEDATAGDDYDQLTVTGDHNVVLGGATLSVSMGVFTAAENQHVYLIDNAGLGATTGTFAGLAEGAEVASLAGVNGFNWAITYQAVYGDPEGSANDVAIYATTVPEPAGLGLIALGGTALLRRRRRAVAC